MIRLESSGSASHLEPEADYERRPDGSGGCEDPCITFIEPLQRYAMTYTAYSPRGPRIALAISEDLFHWERMGLAIFMPYEGVDFNDVNNKDALWSMRSATNIITSAILIHTRG